MKSPKTVSTVLFIASFIAFCLWDRSNANGFWFTGFFAVSCVLLANSILFSIEKSWVRVFRGSIILGVLMNLVEVLYNGGRMPVIAYIPRAITGMWFRATADSKLLALCDRFTIGGAVFSLGDFLMLGGVLLLVTVGPYITSRAHD